MSRVWRWMLILGGGLLVITIVTVGAMEFTSRPQFCRTCHYMEPFYIGWEQSAHADVSCTTCHFEPGIAGTIRGKTEGLVQLGKYATRSYTKSKPWAEISDESCLRPECHQEANLTANVSFKGIDFTHESHLTGLRRDRELRCTSCHSQIVQGEHITVTTSTCFTCHFKGIPGEEKVASCSLCHTEEVMMERAATMRFDHSDVLANDLSCNQCHTNTIIGDGAVYTESCYNCHFEPDRLDKISDTKFLHQTHITDRKIECQQCHLTIQHKVQRVSQITGSDCQSCHPNRHDAQISLFTGTAGGDHILPSPMQSAGLSCRTCHIFHQQADGNSGAETFVAGGQSCEHCHGEGFDRLLDKWNVSSEEQIAVVESAYKKVLASINDASDEDASNMETIRLLADARSKIDVVIEGKSAHNMGLSHELLTQAYDQLGDIAVEINPTLPLPKIVHGTELVPGECINCHLGVESKEIEVYGLTFDHRRHLTSDVSCSTCHSNLQVHGELLLKKQECLTCHHTQEEKSCTSCHTEQEELLSGTARLFPGDPDPMWDDDVTCAECHEVDAGTVITSAETCADCHDDDYPPMVEEWRAEINSLLKSLPEHLRADRARWLEKERSLGGHNPQAIIDNLTDTLEE